jgi:hypothetical protein
VGGIYSIDTAKYDEWRKQFGQFSLSPLVAKQDMNNAVSGLYRRMCRDLEVFDMRLYTWHGNGD